MLFQFAISLLDQPVKLQYCVICVSVLSWSQVRLLGIQLTLWRLELRPSETPNVRTTIY